LDCRKEKFAIEFWYALREVAGYSVPVFILAEAKRGTATFSQLNFLEIIFFRFRERFIDEGQYCLHRLPLFGIDLLHAVDARLLGSTSSFGMSMRMESGEPSSALPSAF